MKKITLFTIAILSTLFLAEYSSETNKISVKVIAEKIDVVIAVGGDGTVNECAKAIIGSKTALGVIPCGSGNGFAFHFGMKKDITKAILQLNSCTISVIDSCTANNIPFVNVSGIGFDAHIAHLFSDLKERGFLNYLKLIKNEIFTYKKSIQWISASNLKEPKKTTSAQKVKINELVLT